MADEFDSAKFIAEKNAAQVNGKAAVAEPAKVVETVVHPASPESVKEHIPRSARREINRLRNEAAYERGRREAMEATFNRTTAAQPVTKAANEEPNRNDFKTDAEYAAALTKYEVKQQVSKSQADDAVLAQLKSDVNDANKSREEQIPLIPEWDKILKQADKIDLRDQLHLQYLIAVSPMQAHVIEYLVQHPEETQKIINFAGNDLIQGRMINRIEGKVEAVYNTRKAAQASSITNEDRNHLAEASQAGRIERKPLPKPSSEVSAKGGNAPPSEPRIGSPEWMEMRNAAQYGPQR